MRWTLTCVGILGLVTAACGRSDDSSDATTAATAAATTAAPATTAAATDTTAAASDTTAGGAAATTTAAPATTAAPDTSGYALTAADIATQCASEPLQASDVGVSADKITVEVMADTGSPLAPGLFQGNIDAVKAFADYINANGGIGCRQLEVRSWDSKIDPTEAKNGLIDSCANAFAMIGNNALFNPDPSPMTECVDKAGAPTGLPNIAALANDVNELCAATTFTINPRSEQCPVNIGQPRDFSLNVGHIAYVVAQHPEGLHGLYLVPGDLPTTRQSAIPAIEAQKQLGIGFDGTPLVSGRDEQAAYTPRVQILQQKGGNYVQNGSNDVAMIRMQKESVAQGIDHDSVVWMCSVACYTGPMLEQGGDTVNGTYLAMQFLPFEEADTNAAAQAYLDSIGNGNEVSWGAQAWQAAIAFQQVVNQIVADQGPNAITRANVLNGLAGLDNFTADGWSGAKSLRGLSPCFLLMQIQDGKFVRVYPEERGTMDCDEGNIVHVTAEPVSAADQLS